MSEPHGFTEGQPVWVEMGEGKERAAIFVGEVEAASWFGGVPSVRVLDPETDSLEVVQIFRITPRDE